VGRLLNIHHDTLWRQQRASYYYYFYKYTLSYYKRQGVYADKLQLKAAIVLPQTRQIQARSTQTMGMVLSIYIAPASRGPLFIA
jgi:hypothetical protein